VAGPDSNDFASLSWNDSVVRVLDGEHPQLHGIDCPEKGQAFGKMTKLATSALVFDRPFTVKPYATDKYK
jgi:endonuclease YncB( thermonuclease family)